MVLLPKEQNLENEKNYRSIMCLSISCKIMTGITTTYMRKHTMTNDIWDEGQSEAVIGVQGTMDLVIVDRCIVEEVKEYHRNLVVAFYEYKKAYDTVHHDLMLTVCRRIGILNEVICLVS